MCKNDSESRYRNGHGPSRTKIKPIILAARRYIRNTAPSVGRGVKALARAEGTYADIDTLAAKLGPAEIGFVCGA